MLSSVRHVICVLFGIDFVVQLLLTWAVLLKNPLGASGTVIQETTLAQDLRNLILSLQHILVALPMIITLT